MNILKRIYVTVFPETWCCALRYNVNNENNILVDKSAPFVVLSNTRRYWCADPFLFEQDGKVYLFFEAFDRLKRKGLLGYREITDGNIGDIKIFYESDSHLSYPFIFEDEGSVYIIPESNKSGELFRLKCERFPDIWIKEKTLLNEKLADTSRFDYKGIVYYFSEKVDDTNTFDRLDLYYEKNGELVECDNNPVKNDVSTARCAGKVFSFNEDYIRPSQNCGNSYGEELNFSKIVYLNTSSYKEEMIQSISYSDLNINKSNSYSGIHTYNKLGNIEVIDLKLKRRFNLFNFFGVFYKFIIKF